MTRQQLLFGERLRKRRKALHYTQEYVAEQVGITLRKTLTISMDSLLLGELPSSCENPITEILSALTPSQREDAAKILALYASACKAP